MSDKSYWWTNEAASYSWVKFVEAGATLNLNYLVTNNAGTPIVNALVTLGTYREIATFTGTLSARTNSSGIAAFTLTNTTSNDLAETRPFSPSSMSYWDDSRTVSPEAKFNFTPSVGAVTEHIDRVWTHTVKIAGLSFTKSLIWSEEFTGAANTGPSSSVWNVETGNGSYGWGNAERQSYISAANRQDGSSAGILNITANRLPSTTSESCWFGKCEWSSGRITTRNKVSFTYGYLEARIKVPAGVGTWPAFWTLGTNIGTVSWPACGEIDVMEAFGKDPKVHQGTLHMANASGQDAYYYGQAIMPENLSAGYHTFGVRWMPTSLEWYLDGEHFFTVNKSAMGTNSWPFGPNPDGSLPKQFAILNLAMGGNLGGPIASSLSSATMAIDYVRYYSANGLGTVNYN